jgi:hypothetical protein
MLNVYEFQLTSDIVVRRYCKGPENCKFMLRASDSPATADDQKFSRSSWVDTATMDPLHCVAGDIQIDDAAPIVIREDAAHGLLFASGTQVHAVEAKTFQFRAVSSQDILAATSSARGFIIAAMAGIVAALILEIFRFRARSRLRRIANAPTGMLAADGWVVFDDGSPPIRMGIDSEVSSGPVIVMPLDSPIAAGGPYRGIVYADKLEVLSGERKEVLRRERWALQSPFDAFAIAVLLLAATPLATFWYGQWISS